MEQIIIAKATLLAWTGVGACVLAAVASIAASFSNSRVASKAIEGMTRQPEMAGKLLTNMLIAIGMVEAVPIIAAVIAIVLVFANPLVALVK